MIRRYRPQIGDEQIPIPIHEQPVRTIHVVGNCPNLSGLKPRSGKILLGCRRQRR